MLGIFTGEHFKAEGGGLPCGWLINNNDGTPMKEPQHPVLADGKVRYVGDRVALVVAETLQQAKDAAELIEVDYEVLPPVIDAAAAKAPATVHDEAPGNPLLPLAHRRQDGTDAAFKTAAHVTKLDIATTGWCRTRSSRAPPTPSTTRQRRATRLRGPTRTRTSSGC